MDGMKAALLLIQYHPDSLNRQARFDTDMGNYVNDLE